MANRNWVPLTMQEKTDMQQLKRQAAAKALEYVKPGMKLGLGTGSTARELVDLLGEKVSQGLDVVGVPTSEATRQQASDLGIPLGSLSDIDRLNLTVDGADEIDPKLAAIKGGGAAHLREKIVASHSDMFIAIVDESKIVDTLGAFGVPLEVVPYSWQATARHVSSVLTELSLPGEVVRRLREGEPILTDNGNFVLDIQIDACIADPAELARKLDGVTGLVEHGLFVDLVDVAIIADARGIDIIQR